MCLRRSANRKHGIFEGGMSFAIRGDLAHGEVRKEDGCGLSSAACMKSTIG
jgi:hypothetical protein